MSLQGDFLIAFKAGYRIAVKRALFKKPSPSALFHIMAGWFFSCEGE
jgi:hypothetical protein